MRKTEKGKTWGCLSGCERLRDRFELREMQYLVFGSAQIRAVFKECRTLTANKYNAYMTLVR